MMMMIDMMMTMTMVCASSPVTAASAAQRLHNYHLWISHPGGIEKIKAFLNTRSSVHTFYTLPADLIINILYNNNC